MSTIQFKPEHLKQWTLPGNYMGAHWDGFYVFLGRHRDSDALTRANFDAGLKLVKAAMSKDSIPGSEDDGATVQVVRESHWAVGWIEWIAIHESDSAALKVAEEIREGLEGYPVVDENLWSQYEQSDADLTWKNCFNPKERVKYIREHKSQFEFRGLADMIGCVRGNYFAGYASELLH